MGALEVPGWLQLGGTTGPKRAAVQIWEKSPGPPDIALTAGRTLTQNVNNATQGVDHSPW